MKIVLIMTSIIACLCISLQNAQSPGDLIQALSTMSQRDKVIFLADILLKSPELFNRLEKIALSFMKFTNYTTLIPPLDTIMLPWVLDKIPEVLENDLFINVSKVVVNRLNSVNTTDFNMTSMDAFMADYLQEVDVYAVLDDIAIAVMKPVFFEKGLSEELYSVSVEKLLVFAKDFIQRYGSHMIDITARAINDLAHDANGVHAMQQKTDPLQFFMQINASLAKP